MADQSTEALVTDPHYPKEWEAYVVLRDGSVAHVRPITPADTEAMHVFHSKQSEESIYLRFFAPIKRLSDKDVYRFTHVDYDTRVALVATVGDELIGIARYDRLVDPTMAEVAFNIADSYQGKGVGSVLMEHLAAIGQEAGVTKFVADVLPQNRKMMQVFEDAGYEVEHHFDDGVISVSFRIEPTAKSVAVRLAREHRAEAQSMQTVLAPKSVAVVGVSRKPDAVGSIILDNILDGGYQGKVYVVNSEVDVVRGLPSYSRVSDIGEPVDMAIIAVRAPAVLEVVDDCAHASVKTILVVSSGFAEAGPEGRERQNELLIKARAAGMRVMGPQSFGIVNNAPDIQLNAVLQRDIPDHGGLGLFAQSGGLGIGLLASVIRRRLGVSMFVSSGNRVDISGNDLMQYWIEDDKTTAVGLLLESWGNPRKFSRIARQLSLRKPVIVVKSETAGHVPPGHRTRRPKVDPAAFDSLLDQAGVITVPSIRELVDMAQFVGNQPLPQGPRVAILGNSDGVNAINVENVRRSGLVVTRGPVRLPLLADGTTIADSVEEALQDPNVDAVVICLIPPMRSSEEDLARAISHASWGHDKPVVASFFGMRDVSHVFHRAAEHIDGQRRVIPLYKTPLSGIRVLSEAARYAQWRSMDHGEPVRPTGIDRAIADQLIEDVLAADPNGRTLNREETDRLLAAYGISAWPLTTVTTADEAVAAAEEFGYPVVLRSGPHNVNPRTGRVRVRRHLNSADQVRGSFIDLAGGPGPVEPGMLAVQRMARRGVATMIQSHEDPLFGPVLSFGLSGTASEMLGDVAHRIPPLTAEDVNAMMTSIKAAPLLRGYRGAQPVDQVALGDLIARVSVLTDQLPEIASMELSPVNAHAEGVDVLGATVHVAPASLRADGQRRALT